jgi:hypothetical protein
MTQCKKKAVLLSRTMSGHFFMLNKFNFLLEKYVFIYLLAQIVCN